MQRSISKKLVGAVCVTNRLSRSGPIRYGPVVFSVR